VTTNLEEQIFLKINYITLETIYSGLSKSNFQRPLWRRS